MALGAGAAQGGCQRFVGLGVQGLDQMAVAVRPVALAAQLHQLMLQRAQLGQALAHMAQVGIQGFVGSHAVGLAGAVQRQQGADLVQRHVHGAAQADEAQPVHIAVAVQPVLVVLAHACTEQPFLLVVADVGGGHAGTLGRLADAPARRFML